ncbi:hypothetical protein BpHYR1_034562 [Brachionus plicatilis]|uniref:Uncharacterized protein n=1 Tax=Brachionus plicatilis TaxID=10195 RepID=A0A3M7R1N7_BRAPC|nr:hypothetical protein BpHYR1_034562 [Brachionus plicatilis]
MFSRSRLLTNNKLCVQNHQELQNISREKFLDNLNQTSFLPYIYKINYIKPIYKITLLNFSQCR